MKVLPYLLVGAYATTALAIVYPNAEAEAQAEAECGSLGLMRVDPADLPEGVTLADVRKCREHPLGYLSTPGAFDYRRYLPRWMF
ncbi:hypothetical protein BO94DRAFT_538502 [Aspergillus sclerotioniger CBS 115572]|uniref:Uncharacterized protein n=1 Tax=Aspergillus sclerotioniger CBS 115572 TaxID=1450535 RepID=A0A317VP40_9EURO|nr:hypothetical protein BO94DRAFT_538502 [Aspergillus sclerotioniger CBS 115572]PWY76123.1 hypothetical protein BO94DRAFT_538502 [Aspergillus sclerotioniger CBS 115572]